MAVLAGELSRFYSAEQFVHAVGAQVVVSHYGKVVAVGKIDANNQFEVDIPGDLRGELQITVGTEGVAPTMVEADGSDLNIMMIYAPGGAYY